MSNITKKIVATITALTVSVWMIGPSTAEALTVDELQAQINALLAQIAALQTQLAGQTGGTVSTSACAGVTSFSRNLSLGSSGSDVKCLQGILNQSADTQVAGSGVGSVGNETMYFGNLTKAAVVKFQNKYAAEVLTPIGLTAGTGFVGTQTRAKLNGLLVSTPSPTTSPTPSPTTLPTAPGLSVSMASDNPVSTTIISDGSQGAAGSQALIPALKVNFSTPAGTSAKVTTLKLNRLGVSSDTDIPNAYLYEGDTKLAEMTSLSSGVMTFVDSAGLFTVSGIKTITVKFDLHKDASSGKTIGLGINASTNIVTDASAVNGTFPMNGNLMTVATVTDLARVQVSTSTGVSSTVDPGTTYEAYRAQITVSNQKVKLSYLKLRQLGSIASGDIQNLSLWIGGVQLGSTVPNLSSDGTVAFDFTSAPYEMTAGTSKILALKAEVVKGSTRTIQFSIQKGTDVVVQDAQYGVYVAPDSGTIGSWTTQDNIQTSVNSGSIVLSRRTDSPSGNVALNANNVTLAKYDAKAVGENIKVSQLTFMASSSASDWVDVKNWVILVDNVQQGTTQVTVASNTNYTVTTNFTIEAGKTALIEIRGDVITVNGGLGADDTIKAVLGAGTGNAQRMVSLGTFALPSAEQAGNTLTVSSASLSSSKNGSVGNIQTVYSVSNITIGSYNLTAGAAEGVDVSQIVFEDATVGGSLATTSADRGLGYAFTNLKLYQGSTQLGTTVVPNSTDAAGTNYTFYMTPALSLAAGQSVVLTLKADVLSGATWSNGDATQLSSAEGTGKVSNNTITESNGAQGQAITLSSAGAIGLTLDSSSPTLSMTSLGKTGVTLGIWRMRETTSIEDLKLTSITFFNGTTSATSSANVKNLKLYCGDTQFSSTVEAMDSNSAVSDTKWASFSVTEANACLIPKGGYKLLKLTADFTDYANSVYPTGGVITSGGDWIQMYTELPSSITGISSDYIIARGSGAYASSTNSSSSANKIYPQRTTLAMSIACGGDCANRSRSTNDKVATLTITGTAQADAQFRGSLEMDDESVNYIYFATDAGTGAAEDGVGSQAASSSADFKIDGTNAVYFYATTSIASAGSSTFVVWDAGQGSAPDLTVYSKLSGWIRVATDTAVYDLIIASSTDIAIDNNSAGSIVASTSLGALAVDVWHYVSWTLPTIPSTARYVGLTYKVEDQDNVANAAGWPYVYLDNFRLYNDSIAIDVSGNTTDTASSTAFTLKKTDGTQVAVGYLPYNSNTVTLISDGADNEGVLEAGATPQTYELFVNTNTLMKPLAELDTGAVIGLGLNIDFGTPDSAGDVRWYDQGVTSASPLTWIYGSSPILISPTYKF